MNGQDFDRLPLQDQRRLVAAELRRIEAGGEPADARAGLCRAVYAAFGHAGIAHKICFYAVEEAGVDSYNSYDLPDMKPGNFGPARRALAGRVAGVLEGMDI